jgi:hypothetical protein
MKENNILPEIAEKPVKKYKVTYFDKNFNGYSAGYDFKNGTATVPASDEKTLAVFKKIKYTVEAVK